MGNSIRWGLALTLALMIAQTFSAKANDIESGNSLSQALYNPSQQYQLLQNALEKYHAIRENGGWPKIKAPKKVYMKGQTDPAIKQLKQRLRASGDFSSKDTSAVFTDELVVAVQNIQKRFGYKETGVVDKQLVKLLNVPVESRIQQLEVNMDRFQNSKPVGSGTRVVANIPEFRLYVYEGTQAVFDMAIDR